MSVRDEKCKHGNALDEWCDACRKEPCCRKCHRTIKEGEIAWWAPTMGPQCMECRAKVPTMEEMKKNLESVRKILGKLADHIDKKPTRRTK